MDANVAHQKGYDFHDLHCVSEADRYGGQWRIETDEGRVLFQSVSIYLCCRWIGQLAKLNARDYQHLSERLHAQEEKPGEGFGALLAQNATIDLDAAKKLA